MTTMLAHPDMKRLTMLHKERIAKMHRLRRVTGLPPLVDPHPEIVASCDVCEHPEPRVFRKPRLLCAECAEIL